jgi:HEAT repeat protein
MRQFSGLRFRNAFAVLLRSITARRVTIVVSAALVAALPWRTVTAGAQPPELDVADDLARGESDDSAVERPGVELLSKQQARLETIAGTRGFADEATLRRLLRDRDPAIARAAFDALQGRDDATARQALRAVIDDTTEPTRLRALQLLVEAADPDDSTAMDVLRAALRDPDAAFVVQAVRTLDARDDAAAMTAIGDALRESNPTTRLLIVQSLGVGETSQRHLRDALGDDDASVRSAAAAALAPVGDDRP